MSTTTREFAKHVKENYRPDSVPAKMLRYIRILEGILKRIEAAAREDDMEKVWKVLR